MANLNGIIDNLDPLPLSLVKDLRRIKQVSFSPWFVLEGRQTLIYMIQIRLLERARTAKQQVDKGLE